MRVVQINYVFDRTVTDPDELLDGYSTLAAWGEAILSAGAARVVTVQRFGRDAAFTRNGVEYFFRRDGGGNRPQPWSRCSRIHDAAVMADPDVVHVNGLEFGGAVARLRAALGPRVAIVVQDHGGRPRAGMRTDGADGFFFTARAQVEPWLAAGALAPGRPVFEVLESSTRLRPLPRAEARAASQVDGDPALLWVGRLNANKDPLTVLDGFERCLSDLPRARLTMVHGSDGVPPRICARVRESAALTGRVRLTGPVPHDVMPAYYSAADIFVLGSHHEGSGYALIEACACGAVPAVTAIPSFRVITAGGLIGALWAPGDALDCARAILDVSRGDPAVQRAHVQAHFQQALTWEAVGRQAIDVYAALRRTDHGLAAE